MYPRMRARMYASPRLSVRAIHLRTSMCACPPSPACMPHPSCVRAGCVWGDAQPRAGGDDGGRGGPAGGHRPPRAARGPPRRPRDHLTAQPGPARPGPVRPMRHIGTPGTGSMCGRCPAAGAGLTAGTAAALNRRARGPLGAESPPAPTQLSPWPVAFAQCACTATDRGRVWGPGPKLGVSVLLSSIALRRQTPSVVQVSRTSFVELASLFFDVAEQDSHSAP
jgi:hypothetical protein